MVSRSEIMIYAWWCFFVYLCERLTRVQDYLCHYFNKGIRYTTIFRLYHGYIRKCSFIYIYILCIYISIYLYDTMLKNRICIYSV